jgi:rare lipoprotein A
MNALQQGFYAGIFVIVLFSSALAASVLMASLLSPVAIERGGLCGKASWYGEKYRGKETASGELFDPDALTCASWDYPFGTRLEVRHGRRRVIVTVNDQGPAPELYQQGRILDLSRAAFARLADLTLGVIDVEVWECEPAAGKQTEACVTP